MPWPETLILITHNSQSLKTTAQTQLAPEKQHQNTMANSIIKIQNTVGGGKGRVFEIETKAAKHSTVIYMLLQDFEDQDIDILPISIGVSDECLQKVFDWVSHHKDDALDTDDVDNHIFDPMALTDKVSAERSAEAEERRRRARKLKNEPVVIAGWDETFFESVDSPMMYEILIAANYLEIRKLLDISCQVVVNMIRGKTTEQIREILGIENDFTPEEEEQIRKETAWVFDEAEDRDREGARPSGTNSI